MYDENAPAVIASKKPLLLLPSRFALDQIRILSISDTLVKPIHMDLTKKQKLVNGLRVSLK